MINNINKIKKVSILIFFITIFTLNFFGCNSTTNVNIAVKGTPQDYYSVKIRGINEETMPIGGFIGPNSLYEGNGYMLPSLINDSVYKKLSDCGINIIYDSKNDYAIDSSNAHNVLDFGDKYNISYFLAASNVLNINKNFVAETEELETLITELSSHKSFAGLYGIDEPNMTKFDSINSSWEKLSDIRESINKKDLSYYYNLLPGVSGTQMSGTNTAVTWENYIQAYINTNPDYIMFDQYPIYGEAGNVAADWFNVLGIFNKKAKENNLPWWAYAQAGGEWIDGGNARVVNETELNWVVNTILAFGAKGLSYFPLLQPPEWAVAMGEEDIYNCALINKYGATNPIYYYAQKINKQIASIDQFLMKSAQMGVIINGESLCNYKGQDLMTNYRELKSVSGDAALIGCFDYLGGTVLYVVNNSITNEKANINLNFDKNYGFKVIQRGISADIQGNTFTLTLAGGEGSLVVIK